MENYRDVNAIHYSLLKNIAEDPSRVLDKKDISNYPSVKQGDLFDIRMEGKELFDDKYAYFDGKIPTAGTLKLAALVIDQVKGTNTKLTNDYVLSVAKENSIWEYKDETIINKFDTSLFWDYVNFNVNNYDKLLIDKLTYENVEKAHDLVKTHEWTTHIFDRKQLPQEPIYFKMDLVYDESKKVTQKFKILPDLITFDEKRKIIYPYDYKFLSGATPKKFFVYFFTKYYYIQAGMYSVGIKKWATKNYPDYKVYPYQFIVVGDKDLSYPLTFNSIDFTALAWEGFESGNRQYPGIKQLCDDYEWHLENNLWQHTRDVYENNGVIRLKL